ncbi:MAG: YniB family protein [Enterobacteriaceae bacterium]
MTYHQAGRVAIFYRILGWLIALPALLSTTLSLLLYAGKQVNISVQQGLSTVLADFLHLIIEVARFNTPFLHAFWTLAPVPHFSSGLITANVMFFIIYFLIFFGLAINAGGQRLSRQAKTIREGIEDQLILEGLKEQGARSRQELEQAAQLPLPTIFRQVGLLYVTPLVFIVLGYFSIQQLGWF